MSWMIRFSRNRLVGLVVKVSASRAEDPGFDSHLRLGDFFRSSHTRIQNWHISGYPARCLALSGQRWDCLVRCRYTVTGWGTQFDPATSVLVWQHVNLSEHMHPWDTLACCWDVKQPTNNNSSPDHYMSLSCDYGFPVQPSSCRIILAVIDHIPNRPPSINFQTATTILDNYSKQKIK